MSILGSFFEKLIDKLNINIDLSRSDNRKIEINNSNIIIGNKIIEHKGEIFDLIREYKKEKTLPFEIIHKDLSNSYLEYEKMSIEDKGSIKIFIEFLDEEDIECILMARRVLLAYNKNNTTLAKKLHKQLNDNFSKKGTKVYNLISSGYFDELIIPLIDVLKEENPDNYKERCRNFYEEILKFFPIAIFVGNKADIDWLKDELIQRIKLKGTPFIKLHAIGISNIEKIEAVLKELNIKDVSYERFKTTQGLEAIIYKINMKK